MKKQGIQITYGNIHTKDIKHFLKKEKHQRKKDDAYPTNVANMMSDVAKQTSFLSLDPDRPIVPIDLEKASLSSFKSIDNEQFEQKTSQSTFQKIKNKVKKTFTRKHKVSENSQLNDGDDDDDNDEQMTLNIDAPSRDNIDANFKSQIKH